MRCLWLPPSLSLSVSLALFHLKPNRHRVWKLRSSCGLQLPKRWHTGLPSHLGHLPGNDGLSPPSARKAVREEARSSHPLRSAVTSPMHLRGDFLSDPFSNSKEPARRLKHLDIVHHFTLELGFLPCRLWSPAFGTSLLAAWKLLSMLLKLGL